MPPSSMPIDDLTGLLSRKGFNEAFSRLISQAQAEETPLSLALIDVDHFLKVNERWGHAGGDAVLCALAQVIKEFAGNQARISRYGGDEYALLFPGLEREQAFLMVEQIRAAVASLQIPLDQGGPITDISITAGLASFPIDGRTQAELARKADAALYRAKKASRNTVRLAYEERMVTKTTHFTLTQLERLSRLAEERAAGEAELLREALDDLLNKYGLTDIER
jgi:diguanylate cyclase